jgi:2-C-methyl-D-erythritol 2,4-cyclodiphosphate synthase
MPYARSTTPLRIGQGFDVHPVRAGRRLILGGVRIPWDCGLQGHSDADVLVHAVLDAILGALGLDDIGQWFPDTDPAYRDADSLELLQRVMRSPQLAVWQVVNLDATLLAEAPRIAPHRAAMRRRLAAALGVHEDDVSVKATTTEGLGFTGRGEGMAAMAVVLLRRRRRRTRPD